MIVVIVAVLLFSAWLYTFLSPSRRLKTMGDKIPGPPSWPLIGNALLFKKKNNVLQTLLDVRKTYGPVFRLWFGKHLVTLLSNADDIKVLLTSTKHLDKGLTYRLLDSWLGNKNLLTSDAVIWRPHRTAFNPSFSLARLRTYLPIMQKNVAILCRQLETEVDAEEFDFKQYMGKCSLDIITEAALGVKPETQTKDPPYLHAVHNMLYIFSKRVSSAWLRNERIFRLSGSGRKFNASAKFTTDFIHQIIMEQSTKLDEEIANSMENDGRIRERDEQPLLNNMLLNGNFTDEEIGSAVQTILFAGHDTVVHAISFCLYELSHNPDIQERVYREIVQDLSCGSDETECTFREYNYKLKYLNNVINETMRKYTIIPTISRAVSEDIALPSGFKLPKGSEAMIFLYQLHRDERYFPNPDQFIPERFETEEDITDFSFIPFSAGPRNCIGQKFAMLEMKIVLSALLQKYKFLPAVKVKSLMLEATVVLESLNTIPVRLTSRESTVH